MLEHGIEALWQSMGIANLEWGQLLMVLVGGLLIFLAVRKGFEPLLLLPIGFGCILANVPVAGLAENSVGQLLLAGKPEHLNDLAQLLGVPVAEVKAAAGHATGAVLTAAKALAHDLGYEPGMLYQFYSVAISTGVAPLLIFMGVGALTDFSALIAKPSTLLLGAAAQFGIFMTLIGALALNAFPGFDFTLADASAIAIIGGADGPTAIFLASKLAPDLLGAIAVAAYSYMALVPIIQPPIMRALTTDAERQVVMSQLRPVSKLEKILFPLTVLLLCLLFLPSAAPLIGMLTFGNLLRESGVVDRLSKAAQNEIINAVTIILGLSVGSKLQADKFLSVETLGILALGAIAFCVGTAAGVLMGKVMYRVSGGKVNPLIGAAGVSAVPMAARVVNKVGLEANHHNFLLMHAMGPNVAGVIGSAVAAGVLLAVVGG
ncbi:MAG: sodium ion-translocating decarboxylase subunit beta [Chromatiaceae bacterium]|nr:sodium ion-translocating decarboxylase subunit beta [Chromatiaceae bacterium]MCP5437811.1 sodium ion-translocating decarboxylase subunit beta [Chromatiaceae bacterium]MCP5439484.1 sodium ion-translocating decarboxylase subunit beta [Chromatiaceae bacterium]